MLDNFFTKENAQERRGHQSGHRSHEDDDRVGGLRDDLGLQSDERDNQRYFSARHHANADLEHAVPALFVEGQAAAHQLGDNGEDGDDGRGHQYVSRKELHIETRADGEKEKGRQKFRDAGNARQQIPLGGVVGEHQSGKECTDDGGHSNARRQPRQEKTDGQREHQRRISCREVLHAGLDAAHDTRRDEDHENSERDGFGDQHAQVHPLQAVTGEPGYHGEQYHAENIVEDSGTKNDLGILSGENMKISEHARGNAYAGCNHGGADENSLGAHVAAKFHVDESQDERNYNAARSDQQGFPPQANEIARTGLQSGAEQHENRANLRDGINRVTGNDPS